MRTATLTDILSHYDCIQIFSAQDSDGNDYLCEMIDTVGDYGH